MEKQSTIDKLALQAFYLGAETGDGNNCISQLLTNSEKIKIGRRLLIAQAILSGKTRFEIHNHIRVSPNTFAQINRWLETEFKDYASAYEKLPSKVNKKHASKYTKPFSYEYIKKKYPAHFLLFSLTEELWNKK